MRDKLISISFDDRAVVVAGEGYVCLTQLPSNLRSMTWNPEHSPPGHASYADGSGGGFEEFSLISPYLIEWQQAQEASAAAAKLKAELDAEAAREAQEAAEAIERANEEAEQAARAKWEAARAKEKPLHDALVHLGSTDHEVIKAMEERLSDMGALPDDFVKQRQAAREVVKAERVKLAKGE
jgi:hypothetical protein